MAGEHVNIHAHGRCNQGHLNERDDENTEPDGVNAEANHQGKYDGQCEQEHGHAFQKAAEHQVHGTDDEQELHGRKVHALQYAAQPRRKARDGDVFGQDQSTDQNKKQAGGSDRGFTKYLSQHLARESPSCNDQCERACCSNACSFSWGEPAAIKTTNDQTKQQSHAANTAQ